MKERAINKKNGKTIIKIDKEFFRPAEVDVLIGDPTKALKDLGWSPKHNLKSLAERMVNYELNMYK